VFTSRCPTGMEVKVVNVVVVARPRGRVSLSPSYVASRFRNSVVGAGGPMKVRVGGKCVMLTKSGLAVIPGVRSLEEARAVLGEVLERLGISVEYDLEVANVVAVARIPGPSVGERKWEVKVRGRSVTIYATGTAVVKGAKSVDEALEVLREAARRVTNHSP